MTLPEFNSEEEFRETWIKPFLKRLGFLMVTHSHGPGEQGKDFFFADIDKFEHVRIYAVQAKLGSISASDRGLEVLWNQITRCFRVPIRDQKSAEERRVSAVYVMASGSISEKAREYISARCRSEPYGENVYFLDGSRLDQLNQFATYEDEMQRRARMIGLDIECVTNLRITGAMDEFANGPYAVTNLPQGMLPCSHFAIDHYLATSYSTNPVFLGMVMKTGHCCKRLNTYRERWLLPEAVPDDFLERVKSLIAEARDAIQALQGAARTEIDRLNQLHQIAVEIGEPSDHK